MAIDLSLFARGYKPLLFCASLVVFLASASFCAAGNAAAPADTHVHPIEYAADIKAFEEADKKQMPPKGGILFIGSSIFRMWTDLPKQMAPLPVFNRAFGGARTWEVLHYMDRIVLPYQPRIIVYYCGSNDVNAGESADAIVERVVDFEQRVHKALPKTLLYFVSVNRAPQKREHWDIVDAVNTTVRAKCSPDGNFRFIDVNPTLVGADGEPLMRLFQPDHLHLEPEAYERFTTVVRPEMEKGWREVTAEKPATP